MRLFPSTEHPLPFRPLAPAQISDEANPKRFEVAEDRQGKKELKEHGRRFIVHVYNSVEKSNGDPDLLERTTDDLAKDNVNLTKAEKRTYVIVAVGPAKSLVVKM